MSYDRRNEIHDKALTLVKNAGERKGHIYNYDKDGILIHLNTWRGETLTIFDKNNNLVFGANENGVYAFNDIDGGTWINKVNEQHRRWALKSHKPQA